MPAYPGSKHLLRGIRVSQDVEFADLLRWFARGSYNIALRTGEATDGRHLVILDFDAFEDWITWYGQTKIISYSVMTNRGKHVYLWSKEPVPLDARSPLCEVKANGAVCLAVGSVIDGVERKGSGEIMEIERLGDILDIHNERGKNPVAPAINITIPGDNNTVNVFSSFDVADGGADILTKIKASLPIVQYLEPYQPVLNGDKFGMSFCPGHDDKLNRSLGFNYRLDLAKCFNPKCSLAGRWRDVVGLHSALNGISMSQAVADLANRMNL